MVKKAVFPKCIVFVFQHPVERHSPGPGKISHFLLAADTFQIDENKVLGQLCMDLEK